MNGLNNYTDSDLISFFIEGNNNAFGVLFERYFKAVKKQVTFIVTDKDDTDDYVQEIFLSVAEKIKSGKYKDEGKFYQWLCFVAKNMTFDFLRRKKHRNKFIMPLSKDFDIFEKYDISNPEKEIGFVIAEQNKKIGLLLNTLSQDQSEVLILRYYFGLRFHQIETLTGVSNNTLKGKKRYALNNINKLIKQKNIQL